MTIYQPYTYLIGWSKLNYWYYGCQYGKKANSANLWVNYFTSSEIVKYMRFWHGEPDIVQVRMIFKTAKQTMRCEEKVLMKINAAQSKQWLNRHNGNRNFYGNKGGNNKGTKRPDASIYMLKNNPSHKPEIVEKIRAAKLGIPNEKISQRFKDTVICKDLKGNIFRISKNDFKNRYDLVGINFGKKLPSRKAVISYIV